MYCLVYGRSLDPLIILDCVRLCSRNFGKSIIEYGENKKKKIKLTNIQIDIPIKAFLMFEMFIEILFITSSLLGKMAYRKYDKNIKIEMGKLLILVANAADNKIPAIIESFNVQVLEILAHMNTSATMKNVRIVSTTKK
tara:strand:+ start:1839 stop:2255 length:417 start_codon:yes stop_codon:yes gene_type:complete